jgi:hypothetical protein
MSCAENTTLNMRVSPNDGIYIQVGFRGGGAGRV